MSSKRPKGICRSLADALAMFLKEYGYNNDVPVSTIYQLLDTNQKKKTRKADIALFLRKEGLVAVLDKEHEKLAKIKPLKVSDEHDSASERSDDEKVKKAKPSSKKHDDAISLHLSKNLPTVGRAPSRRTPKPKHVFDPSDLPTPSPAKKQAKKRKEDKYKEASISDSESLSDLPTPGPSTKQAHWRKETVKRDSESPLKIPTPGPSTKHAQMGKEAAQKETVKNNSESPSNLPTPGLNTKQAQKRKDATQKETLKSDSESDKEDANKKRKIEKKTEDKLVVERHGKKAKGKDDKPNATKSSSMKHEEIIPTEEAVSQLDVAMDIKTNEEPCKDDDKMSTASSTDVNSSPKKGEEKLDNRRLSARRQAQKGKKITAASTDKSDIDSSSGKSIEESRPSKKSPTKEAPAAVAKLAPWRATLIRKDVASMFLSDDESSSSSSSSDKRITLCSVCKTNVDVPLPDVVMRGNRNTAAKQRCVDCKKQVAHGCCVSWKGIPWTCDLCLKCCLCDNKGRGELVICQLCMDPYHQHCGNISKSQDKSDWYCKSCISFKDPGYVKEKPKEFLFDSPTKPLKKREAVAPKSPSPSLVVGEEENGLDEVPDCSAWGYEQVHSYFEMYVPITDAKVFLDNKINGKKLKSLDREHVLTRFNLKLGSALNIYTVVKRLQCRSWNISKCWM